MLIISRFSISTFVSSTQFFWEVSMNAIKRIFKAFLLFLDAFLFGGYWARRSKVRSLQKLLGPQLPPLTREQFVQEVERRFPGKGEAVMELLHPFCDWDGKLQPDDGTVQEETESVGKALCPRFRYAQGVRVFHLHEFQQARASLLYHFHWFFKDEGRASFPTELIGTYVERTRVCVVDEDKKTPAEIFEGLLDRLLKPYGKLVLLEDFDCGPGLSDAVRLTFKQALLLPCLHLLADQPEKAAEFRPLLAQYLKGRAIAGFDFTWHLLVFIK
jgi:hypothetical protein